MAQLRKFEIDAIVDTIISQYKKQNTLTEEDKIKLEQDVLKNIPELIELNLIQEQIKALENAETALLKLIKDKIKNTYSCYIYESNMEDILTYIISRNNQKTLNRHDITNLVILNSSMTDFNEIVTNVLKQLK